MPAHQDQAEGIGNLLLWAHDSGDRGEAVIEKVPGDIEIWQDCGAIKVKAYWGNGLLDYVYESVDTFFPFFLEARARSAIKRAQKEAAIVIKLREEFMRKQEGK